MNCIYERVPGHSTPVLEVLENVALAITSEFEHGRFRGTAIGSVLGPGQTFLRKNIDR